MLGFRKSTIDLSRLDDNGKSDALFGYQLLLNKFCDLEMLSHVFGSCIDKLRDKHLVFVPYVQTFPNKIAGLELESFMSDEPCIYAEHLRAGCYKINVFEEQLDEVALNIIINNRTLLSMSFDRVKYVVNYYPGQDWYLLKYPSRQEIMLNPAYQFKYKYSIIDNAIVLLEELIANKKYLNEETCGRVISWLKLFKDLRKNVTNNDLNPYYREYAKDIDSLRLSHCDTFQDFLDKHYTGENMNLF